MHFVPEGQHDRSHSTRYRLLLAGLARSAWKGVHRENRPLGYGMIERSYHRPPWGISLRRCVRPYCGIRNLVASIIESVPCGDADQTVPYGTALLGGAFPGTSCQARHEQAIARRMATIMLSLRDESHRPSKGLALHELNFFTN
jgi:hypothetical protein